MHPNTFCNKESNKQNNKECIEMLIVLSIKHYKTRFQVKQSLENTIIVVDQKGITRLIAQKQAFVSN